MKSITGDLCYISNNRFAYLKDSKKMKELELEYKAYNFVPTYDKWCLYCEYKNAEMSCPGCKTVYFCNETCKQNAWPVHKNHCGRDQFILCSTCGAKEPKLKCENCPVKFCSENCRSIIMAPHYEYDCRVFNKFFGVNSSTPSSI